MIASSFFSYLLHYIAARSVYEWFTRKGQTGAQLVALWPLVLAGALLLVVLWYGYTRVTGGGSAFPEERRAYRWQRGRERARERTAKKRRGRNA